MFTSNLSSSCLFAIGGLGMTEMLVIGMIAVLLFGKKLPEVAKQLGGSYRDFRKGLSDIQSHMDVSDSYNAPASYTPSRSSDDYDDYDEVNAPKFEPPPAEPTADKDSQAPTGDIDKSVGEK